jgi:hypothetical protein
VLAVARLDHDPLHAVRHRHSVKVARERLLVGVVVQQLALAEDSPVAPRSRADSFSPN